MGAIKLGFVVQRPPYKSENARLALTHSISSQTAEIHLEDGETVVPTLIFVGDGILNALKNQQAMKYYGVTSTESHIKNGLLIDMPIWICKEDMQRLGLKEDQVIADAEDMGAELKVKFASFDEIQKEIEACPHLFFF
jgi:sulfur relay (sulfurtransferase) DsrF/TusC family protein